MDWETKRDNFMSMELPKEMGEDLANFSFPFNHENQEEFYAARDAFKKALNKWEIMWQPDGTFRYVRIYFPVMHTPQQ